MSFTEGKWEQGTPQSDAHLWIGADEFVDFAAVATRPAAPAQGLLYVTVPSTAAAKFFKSPEATTLRSGVYASSAIDQEQFGTAASVPGPSTVANTGGPLGLSAGFPPLTAAQLATLGNVQRGPLAKGWQVNSIDVVYQVLAVTAGAATAALTKTQFQNLVAPVVTNIIALGANGLPTAIGAQPQVTNIPVTSPAMIVPAQAGDTAVLVNINLTAGSGGTINFYGVMLNCSYNLN
jgi:hypothetical protein